MSRLIRQRTPSQCAIATITMATGKPYKKVLSTALKGGWFVEGEGCYAEGAILEALGYSNDFSDGEPVGDFVCKRRGILSPEFFRSLAWGRRAIFTVPSLNNPGGHHSVYWDGRRVLDPNQPDRKRYTSWSELQPSEAILFREAA